MKICLIGASGFVGSRLIELLKEHHEVRNLDKRESSFHPAITRIVDVRDANGLRQKLAGQDVVVLLAAEHRDDVSPVSLYYDVNVQGAKNVLEAMDANGIRDIIFMSSVAVYGLNKENPAEDHPVDPFNHYGKSKWQAEEVLRDWHEQDLLSRSVTVIRSTVVFGERNRGNVYNLLRQIAGGRFLMIGKGNNKKSMAYIGNIVAFIQHCLHRLKPGYEVYNYVDKPDFTMNELVAHVGQVLKKSIPALYVPYVVGMLGGYTCDLAGRLLGKKFAISAVRVKKFCATTQYDSLKLHDTGFRPPFSLSEGLARTLVYEFAREEQHEDEVVFVTE